jgi:hypothetical protein
MDSDEIQTEETDQFNLRQESEKINQIENQNSGHNVNGSRYKDSC